MRKEILKTEKYIFDLQAGEYIVYVFSDEENTLEFYIQKKQYGLISYALGIEVKSLDETMEEFIDRNLNEWIMVCEHDIAKLES